MWGPAHICLPRSLFQSWGQEILNAQSWNCRCFTKTGFGGFKRSRGLPGTPSKGGHDAPSTHCPITPVLSGPSHTLTQWHLRTSVTHRAVTKTGEGVHEATVLEAGRKEQCWISDFLGVHRCSCILPSGLVVSSSLSQWQLKNGTRDFPCGPFVREDYEVQRHRFRFVPSKVPKDYV